MAEEVEMTPVAAEEPPKAANPLAPKVPTIKPAAPGASALKPGLKLPPKPGLAAGAAPAASGAALKPGLKLPTQTGLKPGVKLPAKPMIRKPGSTVVAAPLPKPVTPVAAPKPAEAAAPAQKPLETLKSVTQKLKGTTQEIPQQAILRKTGIIADAAATDAQKEAAKHKTARIALSDAMGAAPVKNDGAPLKTIRIKRPAGIPAAQPAPAGSADPASAEGASENVAADQRKTLKIARPGGGAVRPTGKFGVKRPGQAPAAAPAAPADGAVPEIADIPEMPVAPMPVASKPADEGPAWLWAFSTLIQIAACVAIGALAWFLFQNTQTAYF